MPYEQNRHHRRSMRLPGYDYSLAGAYFITLVTYDRLCLFGDIWVDEITVSPFGRVVMDEWLKTPEIRPGVQLGDFVVMPNHLHAIVWFCEVGAHSCAAMSGDVVPIVGAHSCAPLLYRPKRSLGSLVAGFKSATTKQINLVRGTPGKPVWQRNYYDRIIRSERELANISDYISNNPFVWEKDDEYPGL